MNVEQVGADLLAQKESEWKKREAELLKQLYKKDATSELQQDLDIRFKKVETTTSDLEKNFSKFENDVSKPFRFFFEPCYGLRTSKFKKTIVKSKSRILSSKIVSQSWK